MGFDCKRFFPLGIVVGLLIPGVLSAQTLEIEAEAFTTYNDVAGYVPQSVPGSGCSGGYILIGLDYADEWTEYNVPVTAFGYYSLMIKGKGVLNQPYSLRMVFTPEGTGTEQIADFSFTGTGFG